MFKIIFALMVLVNVAVFLWPAGDKAPFFDSRSDDTLPSIKADSMLLLTETVMTDRTATSSPALAQPTASQTAAPADTPAKIETPEKASQTDPAPEGESPAGDNRQVAVAPITLPALSNQRRQGDNAVKTPDPKTADKPNADQADADAKTDAKTEVSKPAPKPKQNSASPAKSGSAPADPDAKDAKQDTARKEAAPAKSAQPKPVKPEKKTAVAKADPAPAPGVCVRIGPFAKDANLQAAASLVAGFGAAFTQRTVASRDVRTWRVFAGPFESEQETLDKDAVLAIAGFTDRYVMNDLNGQKFISLGVFSAEQSAAALRERLADQPMAINIRPEIRQLNPTKWLEVTAPGLTPADKSSLEAHAWPTRRVQVRAINCRNASG